MHGVSFVPVQLYIQRDIRGYTPVAGDLAYPDKLLVTADIAQDRDRSHSDSDAVFSASGNEVLVYGFCVLRVLYFEFYNVSAVSIFPLAMFPSPE